jgi:hypothetical protein
MVNQEVEPKTPTNAEAPPREETLIPEEHHHAATKIISVFKMLSPRKAFLEYIQQKGNYMAATLIQRHIRGFLCRKKLLPLITEIKNDLANMKTCSDLQSSRFKLKTESSIQQKEGFYGNDFDKIFARDKEEEDSKAVSIGQRVLSDAKTYNVSGKNPFDEIDRKEKSSKAKRSRWFLI